MVSKMKKKMHMLYYVRFVYICMYISMVLYIIALCRYFCGMCTLDFKMLCFLHMDITINDFIIHTLRGFLHPLGSKALWNLNTSISLGGAAFIHDRRTDLEGKQITRWHLNAQSNEIRHVG